MSEPDDTTETPVYKPNHPETYFAARLVFGAALRADDHEVTAIAARSLAATLAEELDAGRLDVDAEGQVVKFELPKELDRDNERAVKRARADAEQKVKHSTVALKIIDKVIHVVDANGKRIFKPAPRHLLNEKATVPVEVHSGAAHLSVQLAQGPLSEDEKVQVIHAAGIMIARRGNAAPDHCRRMVAHAIDDVRILAQEKKDLDEPKGSAGAAYSTTSSDA